MSNTKSTPHIFLFTGPDTYTALSKIRFWISEFQKKYGVGNSVILDCEQSTIDTSLCLKNFFQSHSLFGNTKLAVLKHIFSKNSKDAEDILLEQLDTLPESYFLVLYAEKADARTRIYKKLMELHRDGVAQVAPCIPPTGAAFRAWIQRYVSDHGGIVSPEVLQACATLFERKQPSSSFQEGPGYDLWDVSHELDKAISYAGSHPLTHETLAETIAGTDEGHVFDLVDAILAHDSARTHRLIRTLAGATTAQSKSALFGALTLLKNQFRTFLIIKDLLENKTSDTEIATKLGWNSKRVWVVKNKVASHSRNNLAAAYTTLLTTESEYLFSPLRPRTTFDLLARKLL